MAAGVYSPLAFWAGGAGSPIAQGGVRSLLAFWAGGAVNGVIPEAQGGYRSLLAFWAGGAVAGLAIPETESAGGRRTRYVPDYVNPRRRRIPGDLPDIGVVFGQAIGGGFYENQRILEDALRLGSGIAAREYLYDVGARSLQSGKPAPEVTLIGAEFAYPLETAEERFKRIRDTRLRMLLAFWALE